MEGLSYATRAALDSFRFITKTRMKGNILTANLSPFTLIRNHQNQPSPKSVKSAMRVSILLYKKSIIRKNIIESVDLCVIRVKILSPRIWTCHRIKSATMVRPPSPLNMTKLIVYPHPHLIAHHPYQKSSAAIN